jgi:hypothetical protein
MLARSNYSTAALIFAVGILATCTSDSPLGIEDVIGAYVLTEVSGQSVPFTLRQPGIDPLCVRAGETGRLEKRVNNGVLELNPGAAFELHLTVVNICTYGSATTTSLSPRTAAGTYRMADRTLFLEPSTSFDPEIPAEVGRSEISLYASLSESALERRFVFKPRT